MERFTVAVDALRGQPGTSEDKKIAAEDVVDAAYQKHEAVIEQLERTAPAAARDGLERAKQQADKLHAAGRPARTPEPKDAPAGTRTPQPTRTTAPVRTVEPTRASEQPRVGDRTASPSVRR